MAGGVAIPQEIQSSYWTVEPPCIVIEEFSKSLHSIGSSIAYDVKPIVMVTCDDRYHTENCDIFDSAILLRSVNIRHWNSSH